MAHTSLVELIDEYTEITGRAKYSLSVSEFLEFRNAVILKANSIDYSIYDCFQTKTVVTEDEPIAKTSTTPVNTFPKKVTPITTRNVSQRNTENNKDSVLALMKAVQG